MRAPKRDGDIQEGGKMAKNTSVLGIYADRRMIADAVSILYQSGYRPEDIAILSAENLGSKDFGHERSSKAAEGAATGSAIGALAGAATGWMLATGGFAVAGLEVLSTASPVVAALAVAACGGALGWLIGLSVGLNMPAYVAKRYAGRMRRGGMLISVHCDSAEWCDRAKKTLKDTGARHISSASESAADFATADKPTARKPGTRAGVEIRAGWL